MTCRHKAGDPNCSSYSRWLVNQKEKRLSTYEIKNFRRINDNVVMKINYPKCENCSFEGTKILVYLNVSEQQLMLWRKIDPHFKDDKDLPTDSAPSPAARFPNTKDGWNDAINYATTKS